MQEFIISIFNLVGSELCVDADDGQKVYELLHKALKEGKRVKLSFQNVEMLTSAFLNSAIGQLYRDFTEEQIMGSLSVEDMESEDMALLKRVTTTAKLYYKDPERLMRSVEEVLEED